MTNAKDMGWQIGMDVYVVRRNFYGKTDAGTLETVTNVGRRWVYLTRDRFDCTSMQLDGRGYSSPGKVFLSKEEHTKRTDVSKAWTALVRLLGYTPPNGITLDDIAAASKMLRVSR